MFYLYKIYSGKKTEKVVVNINDTTKEKMLNKFTYEIV